MTDTLPAQPTMPSAPPTDNESLHVNQLLSRAVEVGASDVHLTVGIPPRFRINGDMVAVDGLAPLKPQEIRRLVYSILTQGQRERFEQDLELDTSHSVPGFGRFRLNVFLQRDSLGAVFRVIPWEIRPLAELGLPDAVSSLADLPRGLILVTGPTGSGKSTTLASLIDIVNTTRAGHIVTVED